MPVEIALTFLRTCARLRNHEQGRAQQKRISIPMLARALLLRLTPQSTRINAQRSQELLSSAPQIFYRNAYLNLHEKIHLHKGKNISPLWFRSDKIISLDLKHLGVMPRERHSTIRRMCVRTLPPRKIPHSDSCGTRSLYGTNTFHSNRLCLWCQHQPL